MSLQIWLPLNGSTVNQGTEDMEFSVSGTVSYVNGKIGKCINFANGNLTSTYAWRPSGAFSMSAWIYDDSSLTSGTAHTILRNTTKYSPVLDIYGGNIRFFIWSGTGTYSDILHAACPKNTWTHVAATYDGSTMRLYANGALAASATFTGTIYSTGTLEVGKCDAITNKYPGYMNDVRVYDHCISQKEVHELSRGLCLHYPMNTLRGLDCQQNIALSHTMKTGFSGNYASTSTVSRSQSLVFDGSTESGWAYKTVVYDTATEGTVGYGGYYWQYQKILGTLDGLTIGDVYTLSIKLRASRPVTMVRNSIFESQTYISGNNTYGGTISVGTEYRTYSFTFKIAASSKFTSCFYAYPGLNNTVTVWIADYKLEKGSTATGYVPNSADPDYRDFDSAELPDESGCGNHSVMVGSSSSLSTDSPRYRLSTTFDGTNYIFPVPDPIYSNSTAFSISCWIKTTNTTDAVIWAGRTTVGKASMFFIGANKMVFDDDSRLNGKTAVTTGEWFHVVGTFAMGGKKRIYVNGVLDAEVNSTAALSKSNPSAAIGHIYSVEYGIGTSHSFKGNMSDFRIYSTELSADDVKDMYRTSASMDNLGNMHTGVVVEDCGRAKPSMARSGSALVHSISELGILYDTNIYTEPDGTMWVRAFHHSAPKGNAFTTSDTFSSGVYGNDTRWFNMGICNYMDRWEIIYEHQLTSTSATSKFRWIQQANPMTATYSDTVAANVTKYTTDDGYSAINSTYGGMHRFTGGATYLCCNNGSSSNWHGAVGMWNTEWNSGSIPSYNQLGVSTGYVDVYVRIDNVTFTDYNKRGFSMNRTDGSVSTSGIIEL